MGNQRSSQQTNTTSTNNKYTFAQYFEEIIIGEVLPAIGWFLGIFMFLGFFIIQYATSYVATNIRGQGEYNGITFVHGNDSLRLVHQTGGVYSIDTINKKTCVDSLNGQESTVKSVKQSGTNVSANE